MTELSREESADDDASRAFARLHRLVAASSFGTVDAPAAPARTQDRLTAEITERVLCRLHQHDVEPVQPEGRSPADLQSVLGKLRTGDPVARAKAMELARVAINRYCRGLALSENVSHDQAQSAAVAASEDVRRWLENLPDVNSRAFLTYVHKTADQAIRQARERWKFRWLERRADRLVGKPNRLRRHQNVVVLRAVVGLSVSVTATVIAARRRQGKRSGSVRCPG